MAYLKADALVGWMDDYLVAVKVDVLAVLTAGKWDDLEVVMMGVLKADQLAGETA